MDDTNTAMGSSKMNPMMIVGVLVVVAIVGFLLMSNSKKTETATEQPTEAVTEQAITERTATEMTPAAEKTSDTGKMAAVTKTITMEAGSFYYKPNVIKVKKGTKVKVVTTSRDLMHNFNIDEFNVKSETAKSGTSTTVEFTADKAGTFEYYCAVGKHRQNGQVGKLIVE